MWDETLSSPWSLPWLDGPPLQPPPLGHGQPCPMPVPLAAHCPRLGLSALHSSLPSSLPLPDLLPHLSTASLLWGGREKPRGEPLGLLMTNEAAVPPTCLHHFREERC